MSSPAPDAVAERLLALAATSPDACLQKLDLVRNAVLLTRFDQAGYAQASFLDDRMLGPATEGAWLPIARVAAALQRAPNHRPVHFIFHTGHVGSTLASRLVAEATGVMSLREPMPLRSLADAHDDLANPWSLVNATQFAQLQAMLMAAWRRGYDGPPASVVKATSSTGRIAPQLLAAHASTRAIYMNLRAEPYLAALLSGQNSPLDLRGHGAGRMRRLAALVAAPLPALPALSLGEMAAMSWLAETWSQHAALAAHAAQVIAVDFDAMLADVQGSLATILAHFELPVAAGHLANVARSPVLSRYSKAPEFDFTPQQRASVLNDARRLHRDEIRRGLDWLERIARVDPGAAMVLAAHAG